MANYTILLQYIEEKPLKYERGGNPMDLGCSCFFLLVDIALEIQVFKLWLKGGFALQSMEHF